MRKKRTLAAEHRKKIGDALRGKKRIFSPEAIENIRKAAAKRRGIPVGPMSAETKEKIRIATTGKAKTITAPNPGWFPKGHLPVNGFKKGCVPLNKGKTYPKEVTIKWGASKKGKKESAETVEKKRRYMLAFWKDIPKKLGRGTVKYANFCAKIIERDKRCLHCGALEKLHIHHIIPWAANKKLRYDESNVILLCASCHAKVHASARIERGWIPWNKGKKLSDKHRENLSKAHKGQIPWNKNKKRVKSMMGNLTIV